MVSDDAFKSAEARGYSRGYAAGRRKRDAGRERERRAREEQAFLDRAFLAALPVCINASGWTKTVKGEKVAINNLADKTELAWDFAREALKQRRLR